MENIGVIIGLVVFSILLGMIWYGPLFGRKFAWANDWPDFNSFPPEVQKEKKKQATRYYALQALVTLIQIMVLGWFVNTLGKADGIEIALWLWLGFIMPIMVGNMIWDMRETNKRLTILAVGLSYQAALMIVSGYVFSLL